MFFFLFILFFVIGFGFRMGLGCRFLVVFGGNFFIIGIGAMDEVFIFFVVGGKRRRRDMLWLHGC